MSKKSSKLNEISKMFNEIDIEFDELNNEGINDMIAIVKKQKDTRYAPNVKHKMEDIILITLFAVLAKCNEWTENEAFAKKKENWLKQYLELPNGIPSHDTIQRVISILEPQSLYADTINYLIEKIDLITSKSKEKDILSMDGKTSNGSKRSTGVNICEKVVNTMSVYSNKYGISLIQDYIEEKSNEIPMGPKLLEKLNLKDCVITVDVLNTQVDTIKAILKGKADYVLPVKENQKLTYEEIKEYFGDKKILETVKKENYKKIVEKEHNRTVTREYYLTEDIKWMNKKEKWLGLKSIGLARNTIERNNKIIVEYRYYIVSISNDIELFSKSVRSEWGVENNLHAPLDIVFKEDADKTLEKNGAKNLGIIRRIA
ncbi:MAG: ISAs1 family transposase [Bacilli bacterium]|nr:ISAs1 family transposase [Bacilli bacterium]